jgi:FlaG/FlaF family flagellin (archaellin)
MKGISTVIATLLMLVITLGLIGIAYGYITGIFGARMAVILVIDEATTRCAPATGVITIGLRNDGTNPIALSGITLTGTRPDGTAMPSVPCAAAGTLTAGGTVICTNTLTGAAGTNTIRASGGGSTATGYVTCLAS